MGFLKGTGLAVLLFVGIVVLAAISPQLGLYAAIATAIIALVAIFKPLPILKFNSRGFSIPVLLLVALPAIAATSGINSEKREADLTALKQSDPSAYLTALKGQDQTRWLKELEILDPDQHKTEVARIETEKAAKAAEVAAAEAKREEERVAAQATKVSEYKARLTSELSGIPNFKLSTYTEDVDSINMAIILFGAWTLLYEEGASLPLDDEGNKLRRQFRDAVVKTQVSAFPKLRDAYGPAMSKQLWEADGSAKTFGTGYRTVEIVNVAFAANRNIKEIQTQMQENFIMLRFTRAQYKWFKQASEYQYYDMKPPKDSDIVKWANNGSFTVLD